MKDEHKMSLSDSLGLTQITKRQNHNTLYPNFSCKAFRLLKECLLQTNSHKELSTGWHNSSKKREYSSEAHQALSHICTCHFHSDTETDTSYNTLLAAKCTTGQSAWMSYFIVLTCEYCLSKWGKNTEINRRHLVGCWPVLVLPAFGVANTLTFHGQSTLVATLLLAFPFETSKTLFFLCFTLFYFA